MGEHPKRSVRGQGHTTRLLRAALAEVGDYPCRINAQVYLADMYAQHGFVRDRRYNVAG